MDRGALSDALESLRKVIWLAARLDNGGGIDMLALATLPSTVPAPAPTERAVLLIHEGARKSEFAAVSTFFDPSDTEPGGGISMK